MIHGNFQDDISDGIVDCGNSMSAKYSIVKISALDYIGVVKVICTSSQGDPLCLSDHSEAFTVTTTASSTTIQQDIPVNGEYLSLLVDIQLTQIPLVPFDNRFLQKTGYSYTQLFFEQSAL